MRKKEIVCGCNFVFFCFGNKQLKTATLSLCLVAVFIVALSSVDAALCYILALILRKAP